MPLFQPDDYTKLAVIYVSETCLQHKMLDQALEVGHLLQMHGRKTRLTQTTCLTRP